MTDNQDLYHELLMEEAKDPQNYGQLKDADVSRMEFNASCGDTVEIFIKFDESQQRIQKIKWQGDGCIISRVAMSQLSQLIEGQTVVTVKQLTVDDVLKQLELTQISPGRIKCVELGLMAVQKALKEFAS